MGVREDGGGGKLNGTTSTRNGTLKAQTSDGGRDARREGQRSEVEGSRRTRGRAAERHVSVRRDAAVAPWK